MPRAKNDSIPFDEFLENSQAGMTGLVDYLLPIITEHLQLKRVTKDYRSHLNLLLCNFFNAYRHKINLGIPMTNSHWSKTQPRPIQNKEISSTVLRKIHQSLLDLRFTRRVTEKAHYKGYKRTRTYSPTATLSKLFESFEINEQEMEIDLVNYPVIRLRDFKPKKEKGQKQKRGELLDIEPYRNKEVTQWEKEVKVINGRYWHTHIDLYVTDAEEATIKRRLANKINEEFRTLQFYRKYISRNFNNRSWKDGGRFYGVWYQSIPSEWRHRITINNYVTQEIDYTAIHFYMIYSDLGVTPPDHLKGGKYDSSGMFDPYELSDHNPQWKGQEILINRKVVKLAINIMLNATDEDKAREAIRGEPKIKTIPTGYKTWKGFMDHILDCHRPIQEIFYTGAGIGYQNKDSNIAAKVMNTMSNKYNMAVLPIHDSFLCSRHESEVLAQVMQEACNEAGYRIPMTIDALPEVLDIRKVDQKRCTNYFRRLSNYHNTLPLIIENFVQPPSIIKRKDKAIWKKDGKSINLS